MKPSSNPAMPPISILLVEDDKLTLGVFVSILTKKFPDIALYTAINGRTGVELFKSHTPDIVITDINMPVMNGMQMADKIRAIKPDTKFIVLTGDTERLVLQDSIEKGFEFDQHIVKPVNFGVLCAAIEQCLGNIAH